ncbi:MAG: DEAD/DEAH box helicase [Pirellulales bacterium]|nr:DEAD/DEAH box helicase [Pirellulales bacterium]
MKFEELGLSEPILRAVSAAGYVTPTPIQAQSIVPALQGRDLLGCAQTGTGKTAAFALPMIHRLTAAGNPPKGRGRRIRALVLSPTRELAFQIGESFRTFARHTTLRETVIVGGVNQNPQTRALRNGVDIVVATPGRLLDLMNQGFVDLSHLEIVVLDEADQMLDMGFLPDVRRIMAQVPNERQTLFYSATMPDDIRKLADAILHDPVRVRVAPVKETTDLITQSVYLVPKPHKPQLLAHLLHAQPMSRVLIFTRTKHGADRVVRQLSKVRVRAEAIHGNKSQAARQRTLANFKANLTSVLVATDIAARGIDVDGISHVVNYDLPEQPETYVHRIGRTGRAGATGFAIAFCDREERGYLQAIEQQIRQRIDVATDHPEYKPVERHEEAPREDRRPAGPPKRAKVKKPFAKKRTDAAPSAEGTGPRPAWQGTKKRKRRPGKRERRALSAL